MIRPLSPAVFSTDRIARRVCVALMLVLALLLSYAAPNRVQADDGDLDNSFGAGGKVVTDFFGGEEEATAVTIQSDGKIVAVGSTIKAVAGANRDFALARYNIYGSLDATFGAGGKVSTDFFGGNDVAKAVTIQADGKIVVLGGAFNPATQKAFSAIVRYNSDGSLDTGFGSGGRVITANGGGNALAIQPDGRIVTAGSMTGAEFAVFRYNSNGSLDTNFGLAGEITTSFFGSRNIVNAELASGVIIQSDSKIIAFGSAFDEPARVRYIALARYNSDGTPDTGFGSGGRATTVGNMVNAGAIQSDGKIVVVWVDGTFATGSDFALARFNSDGTLDTAFGANGKVTTDFFGKQDVPRAAAIQSNGKIVVVGSVTNQKKAFDFGVVRYNSGGSLDTSFGSGGKVITEFSRDEDDDANAVAIQSDGQIIAVGATESGSDFALARYNTEQDFALAFNPTTVNAERGTKFRVTLQIARKGGFAGNVTITHSDTSALAIKGIPDSISTTDATTSFKLKIKGNAATGPQQITFTGKSDSGSERTTTLNLVIQ
jgi:uncharacterized delta-60 repeat protein